MKKVGLIVIIALILCLCAGVIAACEAEDPETPVLPEITDNTGNGKGGGGVSKPVAFGANLLKDSSVEIEEDDQSLGIEKLKTQENGTASNGYLVAFDKDNKLRKVTFVYKKTEITQEEIQAYVSNLFVTKTFTYITFVPKNISYDSDYNYEGQDYSSERFTAGSAFPVDENHQSFVIDNKTNKLYPTNAIGKISDIKENFVAKEDGRYYKLSIVDGNLTATAVIPNPNIEVEDIIVDKYGQVFARTSTLNEVRDGIMFHTDYDIALSDDGVVYWANEISYNKYEMKYYDSNFQLLPVAKDADVRLGNIWIKDNLLYKCNYYSGYFSSLMYFPLENGVTTDYDYASSPYSYAIVGRAIYAIKDKNLYIFDMDTKAVGQLISDYTTIEIKNNTLILTKETFDGTKKYIVNGATLEMFMDVTYENQIITIQPLN